MMRLLNYVIYKLNLKNLLFQGQIRAYLHIHSFTIKCCTVRKMGCEPRKAIFHWVCLSGKLIRCGKEPEIRKSKDIEEKGWGFIIISEEREIENRHSNKLEALWS